MGPKKINPFLRIIIAFVPDMVIGWVAAHLTNSGWYGFFVTVVALQAVYFFLWLKRGLWSWFLFWVHNKKVQAALIEQFFITSRFQNPADFTDDLDDYFNQIASNEKADTNSRMKAAEMIGMRDGLRAAGKFSDILQMDMAAKIAMARYAPHAMVWKDISRRTDHG
jgi:hypothetical protein